MAYPNETPREIKAAILEKWVASGYGKMYTIAKEFSVSPFVVSKIIDLRLYRTIDNPIVLTFKSKV